MCGGGGGGRGLPWVLEVTFFRGAHFHCLDNGPLEPGWVGEGV